MKLKQGRVFSHKGAFSIECKLQIETDYNMLNSYWWTISKKEHRSLGTGKGAFLKDHIFITYLRWKEMTFLRRFQLCILFSLHTVWRLQLVCLGIQFSKTWLSSIFSIFLWCGGIYTHSIFLKNYQNYQNYRIPNFILFPTKKKIINRLF